MPSRPSRLIPDDEDTPFELTGQVVLEVPAPVQAFDPDMLQRICAAAEAAEVVIRAVSPDSANRFNWSRVCPDSVPL